MFCFLKDVEETVTSDDVSTRLALASLYNMKLTAQVMLQVLSQLTEQGRYLPQVLEGIAHVKSAQQIRRPKAGKYHLVFDVCFLSSICARLTGFVCLQCLLS